MKIALLAVDSKHPNLALMKIAKYHRIQGDSVEWYNPLCRYDRAYLSKIFNYTPDYGYFLNAEKVEKGGSGYDLHKNLPDNIDRLQPDYSIYPQIDRHTAYGFLTRGCPNRCPWCIVPLKEGKITPYMDVEEIAVDERTNLILMDNNILASDYGLRQIEKIVNNRYRVDFNQALDARFVSEDIARLLAKVRWLSSIRFGCDTESQIAHCEKAMMLIDKFRDKPAQYLMYTMIGSDMKEAYYRLSYFKKNKHVRIVAQPFRDYGNPHQQIPQWQKDMARWAMRREIYATTDFKDYMPRKGFKCKEYFNANNQKRQKYGK